MNPIYTFMDEYEKEIAIADREMTIAMTEASMMMEHTTKQLKVNMALSELKVMQENGTAEDLVGLLMEAGEEAAQQQQGILEKVFNAIARFFKGIANGIGKFFSGNKAQLDQLKAQNATTKIDSLTNDMITGLGQAEKKLTEAANAKDFNAFNAAIAAAVSVAGIVGLKTLYNKNKGKFRQDGEAAQTVEIPVADAESKLAWVKGLGDKVSGLFDKAKSLISGGTKTPKGTPDATPEQAEAVEKNEGPQSTTANNAAASTYGTGSGKAGDANSASWSNDYVGNNFIGVTAMLENGNGTNDVNADITFIESIVTTATKFITGGLQAAINKIAQGVTAVANTANAVNNAVNPKPGLIQRGVNAVKGALGGNNGQQQATASGFLGNIEESGSDDIDPIDAMLAGLAFGGYHG